MRWRISRGAIFVLAGIAWCPVTLLGQEGQASKPTVAVIIREGEGTSRWGESAMRAFLLRGGFRVLSLEQREWLAWRDRAFAEVESGRRAALAEQWKFRAQIVIFGEATFSSSAADSSGLAGRSAHVVLEAYRSDTGELIGTYSAQANVAHVDPVTGGNQALQRSLDRVAPALLAQLSQVEIPVPVRESPPAAEPASAPRTVHTAFVRVLGVPSHAEAQSLARRFSQLADVQNVKESAFTLNVAEYEFQSTLDSKELASRLAAIRGLSFSLQTMEVTPRTIRLRVGSQ